MRYAVVYEKSETGYGAYVPDLPGCVAVGETLEETAALIKQAIEFHLEGMRRDA
jgi:predicted RNase H-like HicB family nuclease